MRKQIESQQDHSITNMKDRDGRSQDDQNRLINHRCVFLDYHEEQQPEIKSFYVDNFCTVNVSNNDEKLHFNFLHIFYFVM